MRPDFSQMTSALGAPTFESSNPGLEAMQSIAGLRQAQASLTAQQIANQSAQLLQPGLVPQQQAQTNLYSAQGNQANAMANIGIPAQAIYNRDAGQEALDQGGLYNAQVAAGLPNAQAQNALGSAAQEQAIAANTRFKTANPFIDSTNPIIQYAAYLRYQGQHPSENSGSSSMQNRLVSQSIQNNGAQNNGFVPGISLMTSNNSVNPMTSAMSSPTQQTWNQSSGVPTSAFQNAQNMGMFRGSPMPIGSIVNPDGSINPQNYMSMLGMQATSGLGKTIAQTNLANARAATQYSGTDENGNPVSYQNTTPTVSSNVQTRQLGDTETNTLQNQYTQWLKPYSGTFGEERAALDVWEAQRGDPAAIERLSNAYAATNLQEPLAMSALRTAGNTSPTQSEFEAEMQKFHTPVIDTIQSLSNLGVINEGLQKYYGAMQQGVSNVTQQARQNFPISTGNLGNQSKSQSQYSQIPIPQFSSKTEATTWLRSLTPTQRVIVRAQLAAQEGK